MDEEKAARGSTVGERLKAARTRKKMSLEDIAAQTRIPLRHLESIEQSAWDRLPAPTYTIGFAKAYAGAVGLDRAEVGDQLRDELGGFRYTVTSVETFEPADPARSMPKWLVIGAIVAVLLVVAALTWLNKRALQDTSEPAANVETSAPANAAPPPLTAPTPQGPVVLSAKEPTWIQVYEKGGKTFFSGTLTPGQNFTVPNDSTAPLLKTGKPEGLTITVGSAVAPSVGPPAKMVSDVSLLGSDLMKGGATGAPVPAGEGTAPPKTTAKASNAPRKSVAAKLSPPPAPIDQVPASAANTAGE
jgi:cytoskeleton protein RodZ